LRLEGSTESLEATFAIGGGSLRVTAGEHDIGMWPLDGIELDRTDDGLVLHVEGEDLVVTVRDPEILVEAVSGAAEPVEQGRTGRRARAAKEPKDRLVVRLRRQFSMNTWRRRFRKPTVKWTLASIAVVMVLAFAVFATSTLGMLLALAGMASLVLGALAMSDDHSVYRLLPPRVTETGLVVAGFAFLGVGVPLLFFL